MARMLHDDRLATVLKLRVGSDGAARIQFHQLLDLLGTSPSAARGPVFDAAYARLGELAQRIAPEDRAAMLALPGLRLRSPRLVAALAGGGGDVARAVVGAARLSEAEWLDLIPALPPSAHAAMRARDDIGAPARALLDRLGVQDRALPAPEVVAVAAASASVSPADTASIGAIVRKIEAFRRNRAEQAAVPATTDAPRLPLGEEHMLPAPARTLAFDFASDAAGRIVWSDPGVAPMVIGLSLAAPALAAAIRRHQPIRGQTITLAGAPAIAGDWRIDAVPRFDGPSGAGGGRFIGHIGRLRRPHADRGPAVATAPETSGEADRLRQLLHELRTPVNAIQGFAEIIQQQLFGPTPHEYRALAASIAGDAARILAGFEELERLARLDSGAMALEAGHSDFAASLASAIGNLAPHMAARGSGFGFDPPADATPVALAPAEAERLCWRLLATLAGASAAGEQLVVTLTTAGGGLELAMALPASMAALDEARLVHGGAEPPLTQALEGPKAGMFGSGFALRLARAEARAAGGTLMRQGAALVLTLPLATLPDLTPAEPDHSDAPANLPRAGGAAG